MAAALLVALFWPAGRAAPLASLEAAFGYLRGRFWLQSLLVAALALGLRALLLAFLGPPEPYIQDEFSLLLQGETLASGRFANPTPPLHRFFETAYVSLLPSYASMYFPGRGAALALGNLVGHPWIGVLLTMTALAVATSWMLRAFVTEGLALVGGILVVIRYGVLSGWINSYFGPGLTALGGVLVLGAFVRLMRAPRWREGIALGFGLVLLMTTRPFEGLCFALPFLAMGSYKLLSMVAKRDWPAAMRLAVPTVLVVGGGFALLLASNLATTGAMFTDPYTHHRLTSAYASPFLFGEANQPTQPAPEVLDVYYRAEASNTDVVGLTIAKVMRVFNFYVGPVFLLPAIVGFVLCYRYPVLWASLTASVAGYLVATWPWSQYFAPAFGLIWIFIMTGFAALRNWRFRGRPSGLVLARLLPSIAVGSLALPVAALPADDPRDNAGPNQQFIRPCCAVLTETARSRIVAQLQASPGRDLVIYRFDPARDDPSVVLVANGADIGEQDIIWAHDLGPATQTLIDRYPDRRAWLVDGTGTDRALPIDRYPPPSQVSQW